MPFRGRIILEFQASPPHVPAWDELMMRAACRAVADRLDVGIGSFILATDPDPRTLTTFIEEVAPKVRDRVAERRGALVAP